MKYYKDINGNIYANPINLDELLEVESPIREDGTILPKHKNLADVETMEDGAYATYYNSDGTIDTDKELELANENIKTIAESAKAEALDKLTVTTESGKVFYADSASRIDLQGAITLAELKGVTEKPWKLAEPIDGQKIVIVTLDEIKEAVFLALEAKGAIVSDGTL